MQTLSPSQVGCGADELIDLLMRCVLDPGESIVDCPPTFTMYAFDADVNNARVITVPRLDGFRLDVPGAPSYRLKYNIKHMYMRLVYWPRWLVVPGPRAVPFPRGQGLGRQPLEPSVLHPPRRREELGFRAALKPVMDFNFIDSYTSKSAAQASSGGAGVEYTIRSAQKPIRRLTQ